MDVVRAGYGRVSSLEQSKGASLDDQEEKLRAYGCTQIFAESQSGYSPKDRKEFKRFLTWGRKMAAAGHQVELVCVYGDRFARNMSLTVETVTELESQGITLTASDYGTLSTATPDEWFKLVIISATWEQFSRKLSARIRSSADRRRRLHIPTSRPPLGWMWDEKKTRFIADPEQWGLVQDVVTGFLDGTLSTNRASQKLGFSIAGFRRWVKRPLLWGAQFYEKTGDGPYPGVHDALISYAEHQRCLQQLINNKSYWGAHSQNAQSQIHPIPGGLMRCICGSEVTRGINRKGEIPIHYFYCKDKICKTSRPKGKRGAVQAEVEVAIQEALAPRAHEIGRAATAQEEKTPSAEELQLKKQRVDLRAMYEQNPMQGIADAIGEIDAKLASLSTPAPALIDLGEEGAQIADAIADRSIWRHISEVERRDLYKTMVRRVYVDGRRVERVELSF